MVCWSGKKYKAKISKSDELGNQLTSAVFSLSCYQNLTHKQIKSQAYIHWNIISWSSANIQTITPSSRGLPSYVCWSGNKYQNKMSKSDELGNQLTSTVFMVMLSKVDAQIATILLISWGSAGNWADRWSYLFTTTDTQSFIDSDSHNRHLVILCIKRCLSNIYIKAASLVGISYVLWNTLISSALATTFRELILKAYVMSQSTPE